MSSYQVQEIYQDSYAVEEEGVRSFLLVGSSQALLIDTGYGTGSLKSVVEEITDLPVMLVNTHADRDHLGCNKQFESAHMHPAEFDRLAQAGGYFGQLHPLWEGSRLNIGGRHFQILLIPGHTPGSIAVYDEEEQCMFCGDSVQTGSIFMFGRGRSMQAYVESMKRLQTFSQPFHTIYASHGELRVEPVMIGILQREAEAVLAEQAVGTEVEMFGHKVMQYQQRGTFLCDLKA